MAASIFNGTSVKILKNILKFKDGTTLSSTTAGYLSTISSDIQTQVSGKANTALSNLATTAVNADLIFNKNQPKIRTGSVTNGTSEVLRLETGSSTNDDSGDIQIYSGVALLGDRGDIDLIGKELQFEVGGFDNKFTTTHEDPSWGTLAGWLAEVTTGIITQGVSSGGTNSGRIVLLSGSNDEATTGGETGSVEIITGDILGSNSGAHASGTMYFYTGNNTGNGAAGGFEMVGGSSVNAASGTVRVESGGTSGSGASGPITLTTGTASSTGNSGNIVLTIGSAPGGTVGKIQFKNGSQGTASYAWLSTDTNGSGSWSLISNSSISASAAIALSKLAAVTASKVLVSDGSGFVSASSVTSTTLGYLDATSSVQTQLDTKASLSSVKALEPNYISNGDAEVDTTGWATYADAAGTSPVDGTAGSANVTWTRTTSTPLRQTGSFILTKDAVNRQGQGASYAFTINNADQAKVMSISFDYILSSGTFVAGTSPTANSDVTIWIYDVTNSRIIQPSTINLYSNNTVTADKYEAQFQTSADSTSYRLIVHVGSTSASAYVVKFDNVKVSPSEYVFGTPITDWQDFPSLAYGTLWTATGTAAAYGTTATHMARWRRVGAQMEIKWEYRHTVAGTAGTGMLLFSLPAGYSIDNLDEKNNSGTTFSAANIDSHVGTFHGTISTTTEITGNVVVYDPSRLKFYLGAVTASASAVGVFGGTGIYDFATNAAMFLSFRASVPIVGWSSCIQMADKTDVRVVAALTSGNPASATSGNPIIVPTADYDSHAAYSTSTGRYTCPVAGIYKVFGALVSASSATTLTIYKNAVSTALAGNLDSNGEATFCGAVNCAAGDLIDIRPGGTVDATSMTLNFERLSGPSAISASEAVNSRYYASATGLSGSLATISWTTKDFDSHNGMSSGTYTVPTSGKYIVEAAIQVSGTFILNNTNITEIQKNGSVVSRETVYAGGAVTQMTGWIGDIVSCVAGDTLRIQVSNSGTSPAIVSSNFANYMSIAKVGL